MVILKETLSATKPIKKNRTSRRERCYHSFKNELLKQQLLTDQEISSIEASVAEAIDEAVTFSEESEYPDHTELLTDVYVSYQ